MSNILSENEKKFFICSQNSLQKNIEKYTNILKEKDIFLKNIAFGKQGITQLTSEKTIENELLENLNNKISNLEKSRSSLQDKVKNLNDFIAVHCENKKSIKKTECRKKRRDLLKKESALKGVISKINNTTKTMTEKKIIILTMEGKIRRNTNEVAINKGKIDFLEYYETCENLLNKESSITPL